MSSEGEGRASGCPRRSQPGGLGKHTGRSLTRTMQRRNPAPRRGLLAETGDVGGDSLGNRGSLVPLRRRTTGSGSGPTGVGSAARGASTGGKVGKVSRGAEGLPHSEGAAYKRLDPRSRRVLARLADGVVVAWRERDNITRSRAKAPWGRKAGAFRTAACGGAAGRGHRARPECPWRKRAKGRSLPDVEAGMRGARLTAKTHGQARPDRLALKPYWGKPNVRNFRGSDGNGGIIRSPLSAIALPDQRGGRLRGMVGVREDHEPAPPAPAFPRPRMSGINLASH